MLQFNPRRCNEYIHLISMKGFYRCLCPHTNFLFTMLHEEVGLNHTRFHIKPDVQQVKYLSGFDCLSGSTKYFSGGLITEMNTAMFIKA